MKTLLKMPALIAVILITGCSLPEKVPLESQSWIESPQEDSRGAYPVYPTAPPESDLGFDQTPSQYPPSYQESQNFQHTQPQYPPSYQESQSFQHTQPQSASQHQPSHQESQAPQFYQHTQHQNALPHAQPLYPSLQNLQQDEESTLAKEESLGATNQHSDAGVMPDMPRNKRKGQERRQYSDAGDEEPDPEDGFLFERCKNAVAVKETVEYLRKHVSSRRTTTDRKSNLYTVYDAHLEQAAPVVERYFSTSEDRLDLGQCLRNALKTSKREYASPTESELFSSFLPCSYFLEELRDSTLSLLSSRTPDAKVHESIGYLKSLFGGSNAQEKKLPAREQDEKAAKSLRQAFGTLDAVRDILAQHNLINSAEFLPCAELSGMLVRILDHLRINGAFRKPKALKQAFCDILKLNFYVEKLHKLRDGLNERNVRRAELNLYRYNFFKAQFFETLKGFNTQCLACVESIDPEYIGLNQRNRQSVYAALSALRCLNSLMRLMATLINLNSFNPSSLHAVEEDFVFASCNLILYSLRGAKDSNISELLSGQLKPSLMSMIPGLGGSKVKPYNQAFSGELRPECDILGGLLPAKTGMTKHNARMRELESVLEKKIAAACEHERKIRVLGPSRTKDDDGSARTEFRLVDYICELVLELTGQNVTHIKSENGISLSSLDALLQRALESPEHCEIRGLLFAGPALGKVFEKIDEDYGSRSLGPLRRLSVDDDSYEDLSERLRPEGSFFMSLSPSYLQSQLVERCVLEDHYTLLRNTVLVMASLALIFSVIIYLRASKGSSKSGHRMESVDVLPRPCRSHEQKTG